VNWNAGAALRRCLDAVFASEGGDPYQVIVVDNVSTDGSLLGLASVHPAVEIIQNVRDVGYARAVNRVHARRLVRRCPANGAISSRRLVAPA
jgi:GT2 family glycosyltransferase